jgi:hypothetical protein
MFFRREQHFLLVFFLLVNRNVSFRTVTTNIKSNHEDQDRTSAQSDQHRKLTLRNNACCGGAGAVFRNRTTLQEAIELYVSDSDTTVSSFGEIGCWNVTRISDMSFLFFDKTSFNSDIGCWDLSNTVYMASMFSFATSFNQAIGYWDTSKVKTMQSMFSGASSFDQQIVGWDVSNVRDMSYMFFQATSFDQSLSTWDVSNVKYTFSMFAGAHSYNQYMGSWNLGGDQIMSYMFYSATSFNQNLCTWYKRSMNPTAAVDVFKGSGCSSTTDPDFTSKGSLCQSCSSKSTSKISRSASDKRTTSLWTKIVVAAIFVVQLIK